MARPYAVVLALRAVDLASANIRKVSGALAEVRGRTALFARQMGAHRVADRFKELPPAAERAVRSLAPFAALARTAMLPAVAALTGVTGGVGALLVRATQLGDQLDELAGRTGVSVERLQELQYAAARSDASAEELTSGLGALHKRIGEAVNGLGESRDLFRALKIELKTSDGQVKKSGDVFLELARKVAMIPDAATRALVAEKLLGSANLEKMLAGGPEAIERLALAKRRYGVISEAAAKASADFTDQVGDLREAVFGVGAEIQARVLPVFAPLVTWFRELVIAAKPAIVRAFSDALAEVARALSEIDPNAVVQGLRSFVAVVRDAVAWVGGWKNALLIAIGVLSAPTLLAIVGLAKAIGGLGLALAFATAKTLTFGAVVGGGALIGMIGTFIAAIKQGTGVLFALQYAIVTNPIGAVAVALLALGAAVYAFWEPLKKIVVDVFQAIKLRLVALTGMLPEWVRSKLGLTVDIAATDDFAGEEAPAPAPKLPGFALPALPTFPGLPPAPPEPAAAAAGGTPSFPAPPTVAEAVARALLIVRFENAPPGLRVERRGTLPGIDVQTELNVGRGLAGQGAY